jgi:hypothetical protein
VRRVREEADVCVRTFASPREHGEGDLGVARDKARFLFLCPVHVQQAIWRVRANELGVLGESCESRATGTYSSQ